MDLLGGLLSGLSLGREVWSWTRPQPESPGLQRLALLVGCAAYKHCGVLPNAGRDAPAMAEVLGALGYKCTLLADPSHANLRRSVIEFIRTVRKGDKVVVFFSGHGNTEGGSEFLMPVDFKETGESYRGSSKCLDLQQEVATPLCAMAPGLIVCLLDCCRGRESYSRGEGGARGAAGGGGAGGAAEMPSRVHLRASVPTFLGYACNVGMTASDGNRASGDHGVYTSALLRALRDTPRSGARPKVAPVLASAVRLLREAGAGQRGEVSQIEVEDLDVTF